MASPDEPQNTPAEQVNELFDSSELAKAIDTEEYKSFLDYVPVGVLVSKILRGEQRIIYVNKAFETLFGQSLETVRGHGWPVLDALKHEDDTAVTLGAALQTGDHYVGTFRLD